MPKKEDWPAVLNFFNGAYPIEDAIIVPPKPPEKEGPWVQTYSGGRFYYHNPDPEEILIEDIAQALSKQCRFAGHIKQFYSVAEHSLFVSYLAKSPLEGLLHDASEAFLVDMPSPIKATLQSYRDVEEGIMAIIAKKWGFEWPISPDTHECDRIMLVEEAEALLNKCEWIEDYRPTSGRRGILPQCMGPTEAYQAFMTRYKQLTGG